MHPSGPLSHSHFQHLVGLWEGVGGGHSLIFGQVGSNGQSRVRGGVHSGSRAGLPRIHTVLLRSCHADGPRSRGEEGSEAGEIQQQNKGTRNSTAILPARDPTCRTSLERRCSHPSGCGLCEERSRERVSVACGTWHLDSTARVACPHLPQSPARRHWAGLDCLQSHLVPAQPAGGRRWNRLTGREAAPGRSFEPRPPHLCLLWRRPRGAPTLCRGGRCSSPCLSLMRLDPNSSSLELPRLDWEQARHGRPGIRPGERRPLGPSCCPFASQK